MMFFNVDSKVMVFIWRSVWGGKVPPEKELF